MPTGALLYEGKAKKVFATDKPDQVVQYFKDDATAFNAQKRGTIVEKGVINNPLLQTQCRKRAARSRKPWQRADY